MKTYDQRINNHGFPTQHKHISNLCLPAYGFQMCGSSFIIGVWTSAWKTGLCRITRNFYINNAQKFQTFEALTSQDQISKTIIKIKQ